MSAARCIASSPKGERVFVVLTSGSLSISQSVISLLRADFDAGPGPRAGAVGLSRRQDRRRHGAAGLGHRSRLARARQFQLQRQPAARRSGPRRASGAVPHLPAGQPSTGHRGLPVPAAWGSEVRASHPRPRHPGGHVAGNRRQVRPAVVRRDDAVERHGRAAHRLALVQEGQPDDRSLSASRAPPIPTST